MVTCSYFLVICSLLYLSNAASELPISNTAPDIEADRIELVGLKSSFIPGKAGGTLEMVINEYQGEEVIRQSYCYTSDEHNPYTNFCYLQRAHRLLGNEEITADWGKDIGHIRGRLARQTPPQRLALTYRSNIRRYRSIIRFDLVFQQPGDIEGPRVSRKRFARSNVIQVVGSEWKCDVVRERDFVCLWKPSDEGKRDVRFT